MSVVNIAVDAMGSDNKINVEIEAVERIISLYEDVVLHVFGDEKLINEKLSTHNRIKVIHCSDEVDINSEPVIQIRKRKDASLVKALNAVKEGSCDAIVSAGSTGAVIAGGLLVVGRINGVKRPALSPVIPTLENSPKILLDVGANDDVKETYLIQNAKMGIEYAKILGAINPKVALLNIGAEEKKGTKIYQDVHQELKSDSNINFIGNIEGRDIISTDANVIVCDGFSGNIALKTLEGTAMAISSILKQTLTASFKNKLAALILKKDIKKSFKVFDHHEVGGSLLIGCKSTVVKAHGSSTGYSFSKAIELAYNLEKNNINKKISEAI
ncbi:MAG: phosphate acyltransferase PlsX [Bacilli bacterium]